MAVVMLLIISVAFHYQVVTAPLLPQGRLVFPFVAVAAMLEVWYQFHQTP
jgi:hypothetical protein